LKEDSRGLSFHANVVQHPETSYADDQKYTKAAIDAMGGQVVLVGHSYGGSVITEACTSGAGLRNSGGSDGTRTRGLLRDRQAF
jgi:pimeloyl-ACP methyl ester carboxylesterase